MQTTIDFKKEYKEEVIKDINKSIKKLAKLNVDGFIGWIGGKKKVAKQLVSIFPKHDIYIEPFMGSAAIFFTKKKAKINIINDIDNNLVNLFEVVKGDKQEFNNFMFILFNIIKSEQWLKDNIKLMETKEWTSLPNYTRAAIYFAINIYSFNNDLEIKRMAVNKSDIKKQTFQQLIRCRKKLEGTIIYNKSYREIVNKFCKKENVLFFFDPPYVVADDGSYYKFVFNELDHRILKEYCDKIHRNNNYFVITYDNVSFIRELYKDYNIFEMEYTYTSMKGNNKKVIEIVITNYNKYSQMELF